jgi:hypothetical protein
MSDISVYFKYEPTKNEWIYCYNNIIKSNISGEYVDNKIKSPNKWNFSTQNIISFAILIPIAYIDLDMH